MEFTRVSITSFLDRGGGTHISIAMQKGSVVDIKVYGSGI
jgi:hypothetical protein